ncbi:DUF3575 domain-containing protein [uncultured Duncaniella sp.]|uniref:DUF3575 domain-containing protein n=1 Tax=uncultured Duncaniella sp. TaxID=2768039 RepID=UPI00266E9364|nr:DUF3575 domain-containing protein [uncultured Duncaniella sp.]
MRKILTLLLAFGLCQVAFSQTAAVKTNLLYDALLNVNLGAEIGLAPKWTIDVSGDFNGWSLSHSRRWKHLLLQPEARYWLCDRFAGHFFGVHLHGGIYNVGGLKNDITFLGHDMSSLGKHRYQGWFAGAGIGYGYAWILGHNWNIEGELGFGYAFTRYDKYRCAGCGKKVGANKHLNYWGPTKVAVNIVYLF